MRVSKHPCLVVARQSPARPLAAYAFKFNRWRKLVSILECGPKGSKRCQNAASIFKAMSNHTAYLHLRITICISESRSRLSYFRSTKCKHLQRNLPNKMLFQQNANPYSSMPLRIALPSTFTSLPLEKHPFLAHHTLHHLWDHHAHSITSRDRMRHGIAGLERTSDQICEADFWDVIDNASTIFDETAELSSSNVKGHQASDQAHWAPHKQHQIRVNRSITDGKLVQDEVRSSLHLPGFMFILSRTFGLSDGNNNVLEWLGIVRGLSMVASASALIILWLRQSLALDLDGRSCLGPLFRILSPFGPRLELKTEAEGSNRTFSDRSGFSCQD